MHYIEFELAGFAKDLVEKGLLKNDKGEVLDITPKKAHNGDAGFDLYFCDESPILVCPNQPPEMLSTGIKVAIPEGYYGQIFDRSGNALKKGLHVMGGVVDNQFRGEIKVLLTTFNRQNVLVEPGQKIAQMVILPVPEFKFVQVSKLDTTERNENGFGSTGH